MPSAFLQVKLVKSDPPRRIDISQPFVESARHQHSIDARRSGDPALVAAVADTGAKTYELSEFLIEVLGVTDVGAYFPHRVTYHPTGRSGSWSRSVASR